jgi:long-chain fatty acid transport protein
MIICGASRGIRRCAVGGLAFALGAVGAAAANAGGLIAYEVGTADVGLASAGYGARAQDASTVFTNPAGMTRLDGTQFLATGQVLWSDTNLALGSGTSAALGRNDGGHALGSDGWFLGGGAFMSYSVSPDLKLGLALTGNFGAPLDYDDDWAGRYYVQDTTLLGLSILPAIAYRVSEKLSLGASLNALYGIYENQVAINNSRWGAADGSLAIDDNDWAFGVNLGLLYEINENTRIGLTWNSRVDLDFESLPQFSGLSPELRAILDRRGTLNSRIKVGITVPQQAMASLFSQVNDRWAVLASIGWQEWSEFGQVQLGIDNPQNPTSLTTDLDFDDTWHIAAGAQYQLNDAWRLSFGIAYDSDFQDGSQVSPLLPANSAWRFGIGGEQKLRGGAFWGIAAAYMYGGTLDTDLQSDVSVSDGGRGDLDGSYEDLSTFYLAAYYNWTF